MGEPPSPTFDISDDERAAPGATSSGARGDHKHRSERHHPPAYEQARSDYKKAEKELKRKQEQLADAKRDEQRREKQLRGGGAASSSAPAPPVADSVLGELRESVEGGRELLARERQQLTAVEGAISEMRG